MRWPPQRNTRRAKLLVQGLEADLLDRVLIFQVVGTSRTVAPTEYLIFASLTS
jgi:hypothetical protein